VKAAIGATQDASRTHVLGGVLWLRAVVHGAFAAWVVARRPEWGAIFEVGAMCGIIDGTLGLIVAAMSRSIPTRGGPRLLAGITANDALGRLAVGALILALPATVDFPVTAVSLFGAVGLAAGGLGLIALVVWLVARIRAGHTWSLDRDALFDPIAAAAVISFVVAAVLFVRPPANDAELRVFAASVCAAVTLAFAIAAAGAASYRKALD
jgi:hypothetical protein